MSLLQTFFFFALVALSIADSGFNDSCLFQCLNPRDAHLRATRQTALEPRLFRAEPDSASEKCSSTGPMARILRCISACPDDKYGQYVRPALLKVNSTYCKDAATFEKFVVTFTQIERAWFDQMEKDSCDIRISDDVEETCNRVGPCAFREAFVAVKRRFPEEEDAADICEATSKFKFAMSLERDFGTLPPACDFLHEPTSGL